MATSKRPGSVVSRTAPVAITPSPITLRDLLVVEAMLADVAPRWVVEMHGVEIDDTSLIVVPEDGEDMIGPSFIISTHKHGYQLDRVHWDKMTEVGGFISLTAAAEAVARVLREYAGTGRPPSVTIH
ncbi:MAG TPA: hypothetical protein VHB27_11110 [Rhodopila sp.]|uniref:hypothetical protein n=1 Tax=Rhodopila sp. TaxID=2480087 RepID=UPI002C4592A2|nr:hypothetical protein [Rhodopila sp.]HVY15773.1 hypothetical protein [Rhodopila sp.]